MSGGSVSYNLRPNKFVERQLFVELLEAACSGHSPDEFVYVSLGGPQLEDQRLIHRRLKITSLVSIEADPVVYKRQLFNLRPSFIDPRNETTQDFVSNFDSFVDEYSNKEFIIWFDYTSPRQRREQLVEYQTLLGKLGERDVLKITMNANPATLGERRSGETSKEFQERRLKALYARLDDYLPKHLDPAEMTGHGLVPILCEAVERASLNAVQNNPRLRVEPLAIFVYQDGPHQMLTITVRLVRRREADRFLQDLVGCGWQHLPSNWTDVTRIKVPNLTAKERLFIEKLLFAEDDETVHTKLPFRFHSKDEESLEILQEYARHYNRYPSYFQVVL